MKKIEIHPLKIAADLAGLSQSELSTKTGLSRSQINMFFNGKYNLSSGHLRLLLKALNLSENDYIKLVEKTGEVKNLLLPKRGHLKQLTKVQALKALSLDYIKETFDYADSKKEIIDCLMDDTNFRTDGKALYTIDQSDYKSWMFCDYLND